MHGGFTVSRSPARHIFGSIIGLKKAYATLDEQRRSSFNAHITLVDIHPTALARDLCLLLLLDDLLNDQHSEMDKVEIHATLFYAYVGVIMPSYCYQRCVTPSTRRKVLN